MTDKKAGWIVGVLSLLYCAMLFVVSWMSSEQFYSPY